MWRVPQMPMVNWNGLPPHREHLRAPVVQDMIDGAPQRREEYKAFKEDHEKVQTNFERKMNNG